MGNAIANIGRLLSNKDLECKSNCPAGISCDCSLDDEKEKKHDKEEECVSRQNSSERVM